MTKSYEWRKGSRAYRDRILGKIRLGRVASRRAEVHHSEEIVLDRAANPVVISGSPNLSVEARPWDGPEDPVQPWENDVLGAQSVTLGAEDQVAYDERVGVRSKKYLTVMRPSHATWIVDRVKEHIADKVVVEIGAGIGVLATALAAHARHVYAIEADPMWSFVFARHLYTSKPTNLTYILDAAENMIDMLKADVAICVTGSDEVELRALCERFAPVVFMPWQDWNDGKAVARFAGHMGCR